MGMKMLKELVVVTLPILGKYALEYLNKKWIKAGEVH